MKTKLFKVNMLLVVAVAGLRSTPLEAASVEVPIVAPTRLQTLERKASEYEYYRSQYQQIQELFDGMLSLLAEDEDEGVLTPKAGYGMLADLLEKARKADLLSMEVSKVRTELEKVKQQRDALMKQVENLEKKEEIATETIKTYTATSEKWKTKAEGLKETIERLLLGEFEYYEVKYGDSLQSIAANPMIYGSPSRAVWLRQVNDGRVKHLDNLAPGEVLIVPRFPRNGSYEF